MGGEEGREGEGWRGKGGRINFAHLAGFLLAPMLTNFGKRAFSEEDLSS